MSRSSKQEFTDIRKFLSRKHHSAILLSSPKQEEDMDKAIHLEKVDKDTTSNLPSLPPMPSHLSSNIGPYVTPGMHTPKNLPSHTGHFISPIMNMPMKLSSNIGNLDARDPKVAPTIREKFYLVSQNNFNYDETICFYRTLAEYRDMKKDAYSPRIVSIGFIHHGEIQLRGMQVYKFIYLNEFLDTFRVTLDELTLLVLNQEKVVCGCYEKNPLANPSQNLNMNPYEVILLDGIFIIQFFLKKHFPQLREEGDIIFGNKWALNDIRHDLLLFENQLPLQFLTTLYNIFVSGKNINVGGDVTLNPPPFRELVLEYFQNVGFLGYLRLSRDFNSVRHFTEYLSILHTPRDYYLREILDRRILRKIKKKLARCPTAIELHIAGVKFHCRGERSLLSEVEFDKETGVLMLPRLTVNDSTEAFLRNLVIIEQSPYHPKFVTSYAHMLTNLIVTEKDVDILIRYDVLQNELGSLDEVVTLFKDDLYKDLLRNPKHFMFSFLYQDLNDYRSDLWHALQLGIFRWFRTLREVYFGAPWSMINFIGGIVLILILTIIQTVCSVIQVKQGQQH